SAPRPGDGPGRGRQAVPVVLTGPLGDLRLDPRRLGPGPRRPPDQIHHGPVRHRRLADHRHRRPRPRTARQPRPGGGRPPPPDREARGHSRGLSEDWSHRFTLLAWNSSAVSGASAVLLVTTDARPCAYM